MIKLEDFDLDNILMNEKSHQNILIYDISYKTLIDPKSLCIRFDKIDGLISLKSGVTYIFSHYFAKFKVDTYDSLPIEKILALHNAIIHIISVLNKDKNYYYYKIFLGRYSYQLANNHNFFP